MLETVFENFEFETAVVEPRFRDETTFIQREEVNADVAVITNI